MVKPRAERGRQTLRNLEGLQADHQAFLTAGRGDLKRAKEYNNVIEEYFMDIDIDHVSITNLLHTYQG